MANPIHHSGLPNTPRIIADWAFGYAARYCQSNFDTLA
jgi:hypothetical protein